MGFVELHCHSYFSLLRASSSPEDLIAQVKAFGMPALALTDCDTLAGAMRFYVAAREAGVKPIFGSQVTLAPLDGVQADDSHVVLLAEDQGGYANLCRIITRSRCDRVEADSTWLGKVEPSVTWAMLAEHAKGLIALTDGRNGLQAEPWCEERCEAAQQRVGQFVECFGRDNVYVELQQHRLADDAARIMALTRIASKFAIPVVATGGTRYATKAYAELCDCMIAIDHNCSLTEARQRKLLLPNRTYALPSPADIAKRFARFPDAIRNTEIIAERCDVSLDFSAHRMPHFPFVPTGLTEFRYLYDLCHAALPRKYPDLQPAVLKQMAHELDVIKRNGLVSFFLIIWDVMRFARERGIRGQGRGSAAGSIVAYLLDISACDPLQHGLLFERFLSDSRFIMPDVDVDFDHGGRQDVVDYLYRTYGHDHVALVANHVTYRARSALRDLGRALGFPNEAIDRLAKLCDRHEPAAAADQLEESVHADDKALGQRHPILKLAGLMRQIDGAVRHLSVHSAGVLIAGEPLHRMIPVQPTTMPGNYVVEFSKEDVEDAGQVKFDALMLRTLGAISHAVDLIEVRHGKRLDLYRIPFDDSAVYDLICSAQTVTLFQTESRAQQQRLPLTQPRTLEELAIQIAIIRPGPIQSGALHPYLRRVKGEELVRYPHPMLEPVLRETRGVWLYQEQVLRTAMVIASFTPPEADQLRRALSRNRSEAAMAALRDRFLAGAKANGVSEDDAQRIYQAISYFSGFGFNKSHAVSFAVISYQTAWLLLYYPTEWYCAFLNAQPLGFYSTEVVVNDGKRRGLTFLPSCINRSTWGYTIEGEKELRVGLQSVAGMGESHWQSIITSREGGPFADLSDFCRRVRLPKPFVSDLIRAGLFDALAPRNGGIGKRRELLWQLGAIDFEPDMLPVETPASQIDLPVLSELESTVWDYELTGLSVAGQFMRHYRSGLQRAGVLTTAQANAMPAGKRMRVAGMLVTVQRPQTAKGVVFAALEDEHGLLNLAMMPDKWKQFRSLMRGECLLIVRGVVQREGGAVTILLSDVRALNG